MNRSIDDAGKMRYDQLLRLLYERYGIVHAAVCECGAVTFEVEQGIGYSMRKENIHQFFLDLPEDFSSLVERFGGTYFMCNHCVNHWGLDSGMRESRTKDTGETEDMSWSFMSY